MEQTLNIIAALITLCRSATFKCDADGAGKIAGVIQAANEELARLSNLVQQDTGTLEQTTEYDNAVIEEYTDAVVAEAIADGEAQ